MKMEKKYANAYQPKGKIFIRGYAKTTDGLSVSDGPVFTADVGEFIQLGEHILGVLKIAGEIIPHPTQEQWKEREKSSPLLKEAGIKTWNALMKTSKSVGIEFSNDKVILTPDRFGGTSGPNKGYHPLEDKKIICENLDPETLGHALIQAFERCE